MRNRISTDLYELVKCMSKAEKRSFSMQVRSKKLLMLFNTVRQNKDFHDKQEHNLRAVLYKQLLASIQPNHIERSLHDGIEQAKLLFDRKLYMQSYKAISKVKTLATIYHQVSFQFQALALEKKLRTMHVIINTSENIVRLQQESEQISQNLLSISHYSTQALLLNSHYARWGSSVLLPDIQLEVPTHGFYSKMYMLQCLLYAALINDEEPTQQARALCDHFEEMPEMKIIEHVQYSKARYFLETNVQLPETVLKDEPFIITTHFSYANYLFQDKKYHEALDYLIPIVNTKLFFRIDLQKKARELHIKCHKAMENDEIINSLENSLKRFHKKYEVK